MSRIHEALKKAEMERSATQNVASGALLSAPPEVNKGQSNEAVEIAREMKPDSGAGQAGQLDFRELQMRRAAHASWNPDPKLDIFSPMHGGHGAEQFRTLRSRLYQLRANHPLRSVLVTSSIAGEGKTFVVSNLVRSIIRQPERRVLVIDADLRRPRLHTVFGAPTAPGLTDYLRGATDEASIIQHGGAGNLCLIPSGTRVSDPSELLSNGRLKILLDRLGPVFDWVIIDSPPCLPVADAGIIAQRCDGVLLVVRARFSPSAAVLKSRQELKQRNVIGVVLNDADEDALAYGPYYGSGHQESAGKPSQ